MCWFVQHDRRWRHVSFSWNGQRLHSGEMFCLRTCFFHGSFHVLADSESEELGELGIYYPRCILEEVRPL